MVGVTNKGGGDHGGCTIGVAYALSNDCDHDVRTICSALGAAAIWLISVHAEEQIDHH